MVAPAPSLLRSTLHKPHCAAQQGLVVSHLPGDTPTSPEVWVQQGTWGLEDGNCDTTTSSQEAAKEPLTDK